MLSLVVLCTSNEPKVVRNYLVALLIGDVVHIYVTCRGIGYDRFLAVGDWNATAWGNIAVTVRTPSFLQRLSGH
jgi:hypothetical protein